MSDVTERLQTAIADRYVIERHVGEGGMATVYLAHDVKHDREVALKVLKPEVTAVLGAERFLREIRITAQLDHPHILTLIDSGASDGFLWYVVPFVRGESLREKLHRERELGIDEALQLVKQVAGALDYAHGRGVIHRDIKPENILLQEGEAVLADFGIALALKEAGGPRLTETGLSLGTPQYMSPEQATGDRQPDPRSDVYSLAAVLYEMLAGEPPHTGASVQAVIAKLMTERPVRLRVVRDTVPEGIDEAVAKALAKVPADRYASAGAFVAALEAESAPSTKPARGRRLTLAGLGVVGVAAVAAGVALAHRPGTHASVDYHPVQLTTSGNAIYPVVSPDGGEIAYTRESCDEHGRCHSDVLIRETAGDVERPILSNVPGAQVTGWSPNGLWLLVITASPDSSGHGIGVYLMSRLGGVERFLGLRSVAFLGAGDTLVMGPVLGGPYRAGSRLRLPLRPTAGGYEADTLDLRVPSTGDRPLALDGLASSADGRWLAVQWGDLVALYDRRGHLRDSVAVPPCGQCLRWPPGEDAIFVAASEPAGEPAVRLVRVAVDPTQGKLGAVDTVTIPSSAGALTAFDVSRGGHTLVFSARRSGTFDLWTAEMRGGTIMPVRRLHQSSLPFSPGVSADGDSIVWFSTDPTDPSRQGVNGMSFDGGPVHQVIPPSSALLGVIEGLDGRRIYYESKSKAGVRISVVDLASDSTHTLIEVPDSTHRPLDILPSEGGGFALLDPRTHHFSVHAASGRTVRAFDFADSVDLGGYPIPSWDGRSYVLPGLLHGSTMPLYVLDGRTGQVRLATRISAVGLGATAWSRSGFYAVLMTPSDPSWSLDRVPLDGSAIQRIGAEPFSSSVYAGRNPVCDMSRDLSHWACVVPHPVSDVYMVRGFDSGGLD